MLLFVSGLVNIVQKLSMYIAVSLFGRFTRPSIHGAMATNNRKMNIRNIYLVFGKGFKSNDICVDLHSVCFKKNPGEERVLCEV